MSANSGPFRALLLTGLGPRGISMIDDPRSAFTCPSSTLIVLADSEPLWGPEAISTVVQPQGALTCRSSTLAVLADSDPFRGLLLTILGSWSDFYD